MTYTYCDERKQLARIAGPLLTALFACALAYLLLDFVLTPNTLSPVHQDDYSVLGGGWRDIRFRTERPVSTAVAMLLGQAGPATAFATVNVLTLVVPALVLLFVFELFRLRVTFLPALAFAVMAYSHASAFEHGKFLGLVTNLVSHVFGVCTLLLMLWAYRLRSRRLTVLAAVGFALSALSKEDFILPPLLLLAFFALEQRFPRPASSPGPADASTVLRPMATMLAAVLALSILFTLMVQNPFVMGAVRADRATSPYAVDLSLISLVRSACLLTFGYAWEATAAGITAMLLLALLWSHRRREALLTVLITASLLTVYAVIPNRLIEYRVFAWLPWFAAAVAVVVASLLSAQGRLIWRVVLRLSAFAVIAAAVAVAWLQDDRRQIIGRWYSSVQRDNERMIAALQSFKPKLDHEEVVGVVGLDGLSPWSNSDAAYLRRKLYFNSRWIVFVREANAYYTIRNGDSRANVRVLPLTKLCDEPRLLIVDFRNGGAELVRASELCNLP